MAGWAQAAIWANGLQVEEIEASYDEEGFTEWTHAETGTKMMVTVTRSG